MSGLSILQRYILHIKAGAKPGPSRGWWLWPGLCVEEAKATSSQAKAAAFRPSRARTSLAVCTVYDRNIIFAFGNENQTLVNGNTVNKIKKRFPKILNIYISKKKKSARNLADENKEKVT
jgi:hypothetical protein